MTPRPELQILPTAAQRAASTPHPHSPRCLSRSSVPGPSPSGCRHLHQSLASRQLRTSLPWPAKPTAASPSAARMFPAWCPRSRSRVAELGAVGPTLRFVNWQYYSEGVLKTLNPQSSAKRRNNSALRAGGGKPCRPSPESRIPYPVPRSLPPPRCAPDTFPYRYRQTLAGE